MPLSCAERRPSASGKSSLHRLNRGQTQLAAQHRAQALALHQLHHQERIGAAGPTEVEHAHHRRVPEPRRRVRLARHARRAVDAAEVRVNQLEARRRRRARASARPKPRPCRRDRAAARACSDPRSPRRPGTRFARARPSPRAALRPVSDKRAVRRRRWFPVPSLTGAGVSRTTMRDRQFSEWVRGEQGVGSPAR